MMSNQGAKINFFAHFDIIHGFGGVEYLEGEMAEASNGKNKKKFGKFAV